MREMASAIVRCLDSLGGRGDGLKKNPHTNEAFIDPLEKDGRK